MAREVLVEGTSFLVLTWDDIAESIERLAASISESYEFETIIGILRGGLFVATLLSDILGIEEVHPLGIRSYTGVKERGEVKIYHWPSLPSMNGRRVLLVDDVSDEGKTLRSAVEKVIKPLGPKEIRTATLHVKPWTKFMPNYHVLITSSWILYPWSRYESVRQIGKELVPRLGLREAAAILSNLLGLSSEKIASELTNERGKINAND